jgi:hypothetical protein
LNERNKDEDEDEDEWSAGVWNHVAVVPIFCRNLLLASHQYEALEQIHHAAYSHIQNATG